MEEDKDDEESSQPHICARLVSFAKLFIQCGSVASFAKRCPICSPIVCCDWFLLRCV